MKYRLKNEKDRELIMRRLRVAVVDGRVKRRVFNKCYNDPRALNCKNVMRNIRHFTRRRHSALTAAFAFAFLFFTVTMFGTMTRNRMELLEYKKSLENNKEVMENNVDRLSDKIDDILAENDEHVHVIADQKIEIQTAQEELEDLMSELETKEDVIEQYKQDILDLDAQKQDEVQSVAEQKDAVIQQLIDIIENYEIFDSVLANDGDMEAASSQIAEVRDTFENVLSDIEFPNSILDKLDEEAKKIDDYLAHYPDLFPTNGRLTSKFGWRKDPFTGSKSFHKGVDLCASSGTPINVAASGVVKEAKYHASYGNYILVDHGNGYMTRYAHLSKILVKEGQNVIKGECIAKMGSTGRATGPHLHFEVIYEGELCDPWDYIGKNYKKN